MRKADYSALAAVIRAERTSASQFLISASVARERAETRLACTERIARELARTLAVDRIAFLKACGIDP